MNFSTTTTTSRGFTLIELLIVVAIIGLLAGTVLTSVNTVRAKARDAVRRSDMHALETAIWLYYDTNNAWPMNATTLTGDWPAAFKNQLAPYLPRLPIDPVANTAGRFYGAYWMTWAPNPACNNHYAVWTYLETASQSGDNHCGFGAPHYFRVLY